MRFWKCWNVFLQHLERLHLPLIQAPNLKKVSNRAALMDIENVRRFVEEKGH